MTTCTNSTHDDYGREGCKECNPDHVLVQLVFQLPMAAVRQIIDEAASAYWILDHDPDRVAGPALILRDDGSARAIGDYSGERMEKAINTRIDAAAIGAALVKMATGEANYLGSDTRAIFADIFGKMDEHGTGADAAAMDCVLQVAVFGKIIYG